MLNFTAGVLVTLLFVGLIGGGYLFTRQEQHITRPIPLSATPTKLPTQPVASDSASSDSFENPDTALDTPTPTRRPTITPPLQ